MIPKLTGAYYAIRLMVHIRKINKLKSIYCGILSYYYRLCNNFLGSLFQQWKIFILQKKIVRIMADAQPRTSCSSLFKWSEFLPVPKQYILSLMNFIIKKSEKV
jgi:hypothetical protein